MLLLKIFGKLLNYHYVYSRALEQVVYVNITH